MALDSLVPLMITRLVLSLKKAANSPDYRWSSDVIPELESARFANRTFGETGYEGDCFTLGHLSSEGSGSSSDDCGKG